MHRPVRTPLPGPGGMTAARLLPIPAMLIEALWIFPWMVAISGSDAVNWRDPPLGLGSTLLFLAVAYLSSGYAGGGGRGRRAQTATLLGTLVLLAFLLRVEQGGGFALWDTGWGSHALDNLQKLVAGFLFGAYLMWRGHSLSREHISFDRVYKTFIFGLFALAVLLVIWGSAGNSDGFTPVDVSTGVYVAAFFFTGLAALALSNFRAIQEEARQLGSNAQGLHRRWISMTVTVALFLVLVGLGISTVVSLRFITSLRGPLDAISHGLFVALLYGVIWPLSFVAGGLFFVARWLIGLIRGDPEPPELTSPFSLEDARRTAENQEMNGIVQNLVTAGKWGLLALVIVVVLLILLRFYFRRRASRVDPDAEEVSESLWSWAQFLQDVRSFVLGLFAALGRRFARGSEQMVPVAARIAREDGRMLHIREIYQGLLWEGRQAGRAKRREETPSEYASRLGGAMPGSASDVEELTREYVLARYGHREPVDEQVPLLNRLWRRLRPTFRGEKP